MSFGRVLRVSFGAAILLALATFAALLTPIYYRNFRFARDLSELASQPEAQADQALRAAVVERAGRLGLPVREGDIALRRAKDHVRIEVRYQVPVDLPVYSVRLHFHPVEGK